MKFSREFLQEMKGKTISDRITGHRRWSIDHERIFENDGKFYKTNYSVGATESQDESPYENSPDEIECSEVRSVEKTVTVYE